MTEIISYLNQPAENKSGAISKKTLERIFEYIREKADLCTLFFSDNVDTNFENQVIRLFHEWCMATWTSNGIQSKHNLEYIYIFSAYGCIGVIKKWLDEGMVQSAGEVAELVIKMTSQGLDYSA